MLFTLIILALLERNLAAEDKARDIERQLLDVLNGINDGIFDYRILDKTIYFSPAYKSMLGYEDIEYPNTIEMFNSLIHPDDAASHWEMVGKYIGGEIPVYNTVFRMLHKRGNWVWILSRAVGFRDQDGKMVRLIGTHTDITEHKHREEKLKQLNTEMETFTYFTSHDMRSPLVNLKAFTQEMEYALGSIRPIIQKMDPAINETERGTLNKALNEDIPDSLKFIAEAVNRMDSMTTALLDLSRIGKREYRMEEADMNVLVKAVLSGMSYEINNKNVEVVLEELPVIYSDKLALQQIFSNIIDNAIKYLDPARKGKITISAKTSFSDVIFCIADNGRGIAESDREKVFQIFRRARNATDVRGTGMGMTFIQATVRQLGGLLWFESELGKGTSFFVRLDKNFQ